MTDRSGIDCRLRLVSTVARSDDMDVCVTGPNSAAFLAANHRGCCTHRSFMHALIGSPPPCPTHAGMCAGFLASRNREYAEKLAGVLAVTGAAASVASRLGMKCRHATAASARAQPTETAE